ncbi:MAG TPA: flavin reductase family protein [Afifellaceae bacterium]|nr:flavin reductase family protein [Afifellaceae bacterium]
MTGPDAPDVKDTAASPDSRDFRAALGCFATGVTVITACSASGQRVGLTVNSFSSVSLDPPLVLWNLSIHAPSLTVFREAGHFTVNVLSADQRVIAEHFSRRSDDKFSGAGIGMRDGLGGAPVLDGVSAVFECRNAERYYGGDHVIFLGEVEGYEFSEKEPLVFCRGDYGLFHPAQSNVEPDLE